MSFLRVVGTVQVAVTVFVTTLRSVVSAKRWRVNVLVVVVVIALGVRVLVRLAVVDGSVTVVNGPVVDTIVAVDVEVEVNVGVVVMLKVTVGVVVVVACGPASREISSWS